MIRSASATRLHSASIEATALPWATAQANMPSGLATIFSWKNLGVLGISNDSTVSAPLGWASHRTTVGSAAAAAESAASAPARSRCWTHSAVPGVTATGTSSGAVVDIWAGSRS